MLIEIPTRSACHGSSDVVSVSSAKAPASYMLLISTRKESSLFTTIVLVAFTIFSSAICIGVPCGFPVPGLALLSLELLLYGLFLSHSHWMSHCPLLLKGYLVGERVIALSPPWCEIPVRGKLPAPYPGSYVRAGRLPGQAVPVHPTR